MSRICRFLLIIVWSSALFEAGWSPFVDFIGVSLFVISALVFFFVVAAKALVTKPENIRAYSSRLDVGVLFTILLYIIYSGLSIIWASSTADAIESVAELLWYFVVLFLSILGILSLYDSQIYLTLRRVGFVSFAILLLGTALKAAGFQITAGLNGDSVSLFRDYNVYTQVLLASVTLLFVGRNDSGALRSSVLYTGLVLLVIALGAISGSRRAIMIYGPVAIIFPLWLSLLRGDARFCLKFSLSAFTGCAFVILLAVSGVFSSLSDINVSRSERAVGFITGEYNENHRFGRWKDSLELYREGSLIEMIFGQGVRSYLEDDRFIRPGGAADSPHNFLLSTLIEGGAFQVILLCCFFLIMVFKLYHVSMWYEFWLANFIFINFIVWFIGVMISYQGFFDGKIIFFVIFALVVGGDRPIFWFSPRLKRVA